MPLRIKFWGVRGSIACASPEYMKYGGNTSCIEVQAGKHHFTLDAGTGIRNYSKTVLSDDIYDTYLLLSHTHWDHINGFPFFTPAYDPKRSIKIMAGHLKHQGGIKSVLSTQMNNPMFPVPLEAMQANLTFEDFEAGDVFELFGSVKVSTAPLNHPNGSTGYRINHEGKSVVYVTDTEHIPGKPDQNILGLIEGADLVIYDSTYTEQEFPEKIGWGHSTWNEGISLCKAANVKRLAIFHHDPDHTDDIMDQIDKEAKAVWDGAFVCREGQEIRLD
jgi:phosphoribosyl 1,2-cyclic phosphodiesterase